MFLENTQVQEENKRRHRKKERARGWGVVLLNTVFSTGHDYGTHELTAQWLPAQGWALQHKVDRGS